MDKKWNKILKVTLLKADKRKLGNFPIERIKQSFSLDDDSELSNIKQFIKDEIKCMEVEIAHHKKWSPKVYHPNVYKSLQYEKRTLETILKRINKK